MRYPCVLFFSALLLVHPTLLPAIPILSLDADPAAPGIQTTRAVALGDDFIVDLLVSGIEAATPLQGFAFQLSFAGAVLGAQPVVAGEFLDPAIEIANTAGADFLDYELVHDGLSTASGAGRLARLHFTALDLGVSPLHLHDVILAALDGSFNIIALEPFSLADASIEVTASGPTIPEPATLLAIGLGSGLIALIRRKANQFFKS